MIAEELMTEDPMTVPVTAKVREAAHIFHTLEIRHLPIVNGANELVGMLSDRDLRGARLSPEGTASTVLDLRVTEIMSADTLSVGLETDVTEIIDLMLEHKVGAVPVVDEERGDLRGIVSYVDVLRKLRGLLVEEG